MEGQRSGERRCDVVDWLNGKTGGWVDGWTAGWTGFVLRFKSRRLFSPFIIEFGSVQAPANEQAVGKGRGV